MAVLLGALAKVGSSAADAMYRYMDVEWLVPRGCRRGPDDKRPKKERWMENEAVWEKQETVSR